MAAEVHLIVGLVKRAEGGEQLAFVVALEAGSRNDVEHAIGAVAVSGGIAAALRFQVVDVLGIDLRPDVARDVGVRDGNAVDRPGHLVPAAHVKLVVRHPCSRNVVGDRGQAVAQVRAGRRRDFTAADDGGGRHLFRAYGERGLRDGDLLAPGSDRELEVQHRGAARGDHDLLHRRREAFHGDGDDVGADRQGSGLESLRQRLS